jgi:phosphoribosylamine--glycine ligase
MLIFAPLKPLKVLLLGSGGREHALADAMKKSRYCLELHCAPGNAGIAQRAKCHDVKAEDVSAVVALAQKLQIDFVVVGGEPPLVAGVVDALEKVGIMAFGPTQAAAQLEGSKAFMKDVVVAANIPTATHDVFTDVESAKANIQQRGAPIVIKTDGLAAGKGVTVAMTIDEAMRAVDEAMTDKVFAEAGAKLVIEDYMEGPEVSVFALCDGTRAVCLGAAQDHKRVHDGDTGPNTGGMGAYSPVKIATPEFLQNVLDHFITPTLIEMQKRGAPYKGILYAGLMVTKDGPKLIEYNIRWGDPETQVVVPLLQTDLLQLFWLAAQGKLNAAPEIKFSNEYALCVVMAAKGYPGAYEKNTVIHGLEKITNNTVKIFHAGTKINLRHETTAIGGRVLNIVGFGADLRTAQQNAYDAIRHIDWPGGFYRSDIGWRELEARDEKRETR